MSDYQTEAYAIEGLAEAVIGIGLRDSGRQVLVYDAISVQDILESSGSGLSFGAFLEALNIEGLGERAPMFIWLDDDIKYELKAVGAGSGYRLH
jgi:hypothetical protein